MRRIMGLAAASLLAVGLLCSQTALASLTIEPDAGILSGFTQYQIFIPDSAAAGGDWLLSQLKFSLHSPVMGVKISAPTTSGLLLEAGVWTKTSAGSEVLQDSDWIPDDGQDGLDVYSE